MQPKNTKKYEGCTKDVPRMELPGYFLQYLFGIAMQGIKKRTSAEVLYTKNVISRNLITFGAIIATFICHGLEFSIGERFYYFCSSYIAPYGNLVPHGF